MDQDRDERIRKRAHEIWEQEGRPDGKEQDHWERAERELSGSELPPLANAAVKKKAPSTRTGTEKPTKATTSKAAGGKTATASKSATKRA